MKNFIIKDRSVGGWESPKNFESHFEKLAEKYPIYVGTTYCGNRPTHMFLRYAVHFLNEEDAFAFALEFNETEVTYSTLIEALEKYYDDDDRREDR